MIESKRSVRMRILILRVTGSFVASIFFVAPILVGSALEAQDRVAELRPLPKRMPTPQDNPMAALKVELGKRLFFDPRLSGDNQMSCATCHIPELAFTDGRALSPGAGGKSLARNTPSTLNTGFMKSYFWDGRSTSLESQSLIPIQSPAEMNQDLGLLEQELAAVPRYVAEFEQVFATEPNGEGIAKALAAFQRTLVTGSSPLDRYLAGQRDALSEEAKRGLELFRGEAGCIECHNGPLLSDGKFYRLGISHRDTGRESITAAKEDRYRFRTPSLRNVAQTGPYMHDGSMQTLDDVVTFYFRGIPDSTRDGLTPDTSSLSGQSFADIAPIVAFLESLSGALPTFDRPEIP